MADRRSTEAREGRVAKEKPRPLLWRIPKVGRVIIKTLGAVIFVMALAVAALLFIPLTETGDRSYVQGAADWMANLDDEVLLSDITLPGTHDSATQYSELAFVTKCQALSISEQLQAGFRYLDIRLGDDGNGNLELYHGFTHCKTGIFGENLGLEQVLADCYAFLESHPTETIVFCVKQEHGDLPVGEFEVLLQTVIARDPGKWLLTDHVPTLGNARGKLVLMRRYVDAAGYELTGGIPALWEDQGGHSDVTKHIEAAPNGSYTLWVQDRYEYGTDDKWDAFTDGLKFAMASIPADEGGEEAAEAAEPAESAEGTEGAEAAGAEAVTEDDEPTPGTMAPGDVALHFLSTKGTFVQGHPYGHAKELNARLMGYPTAQLKGWIIIDFGSAQLAEHIYKANFAA